MALFKTENLTFEYPEACAPALNDITIEINRGEFILVMGKTGSGKSTLLRHFVPAVTPYGSLSGNIDIGKCSSCLVLQNPEASFVSDNVRGELAFSLENKGLDNNTIALKLGETASFFNLTHLLDRKISTLSGGEKVTVAIAGAMITNPNAILLDEPIAQLDRKSAYELINLLERVNDELGITVIISSHISDGIIDKCDRLMVLDNGRVIFCDKPEKADDRILPYYPVSARLFDEHPLTVRDAVLLADKFGEKPVTKAEKTGDAVSLKNVTFAYGKNERDILDNLSFKAYENKIHCIIGANGSGKTTLLKVIAGIKRAYSGKVKVKGRVAYLPQNPQLLFTKDTVGEEIDEQTAVKFDLIKYMSYHPYDLSGGQMQRLALAILSMQSYEILLLDEPSKSLDYFCKKELVDYLKSIKKTIIIVSHDIDFVGEVADYVSFLSDGVITLNGERRTVLSSLDFYTTQVRRITRAHLNNAVSVEDLV